MEQIASGNQTWLGKSTESVGDFQLLCLITPEDKQPRWYSSLQISEAINHQQLNKTRFMEQRMNLQYPLVN